MELSDLNVFRTVVAAGGVTRAAERLHRVQSNVTARIRKLEAELGVELFARDGRRLALTPAGKTLLEHADRLLALADETRAAVRGELSGELRGVLRIGSIESTAAIRLPGPLTEFHRRHPAVAVDLRTGNPEELMQQVLTGRLDAAFVVEPIIDARLASRPVWNEELIVVAGAGHPPIRTARDVLRPTLLAFHSPCPHRQRLEDWFQRSRVLPSGTIEMASYHAILGCAVAGMGIALMPKSVLAGFAERNRLSVHQLGGPFRSARTLMTWRRDTPHPRLDALAAVLPTIRKRR